MFRHIIINYYHHVSIASVVVISVGGERTENTINSHTLISGTNQHYYIIIQGGAEPTDTFHI
jgi:hypothetical protein